VRLSATASDERMASGVQLQVPARRLLPQSNSAQGEYSHILAGEGRPLV
jgi:hypothetical protein